LADKYHSDTQEKIETISYQALPQDSGDLEAATRTITATSEANGIANADYSTPLTLPVPGDSRLEILRIVTRLAVTIDSFNAGCTELNCRVYVDQQDDDHRLFDLSGANKWTSIGAKVSAVDVHSGVLATIFGVVKDGAVHTFYIFCWVDTGDSVISLAQLWEAVGSCTISPPDGRCLQLKHTGLVTCSGVIGNSGGSGMPSVRVHQNTEPWVYYYIKTGDGYFQIESVMWYNFKMGASGTVATDLNHVRNLEFILRSLQ
jgi:hypothetical protein